jgi:hypothetical protein
MQTFRRYLREYGGGCITSINIEARLLVTFRLWPDEHLLGFHSEFALKGLEDDT